jgi:hypothetical protein
VAPEANVPHRELDMHHAAAIPGGDLAFALEADRKLDQFYLDPKKFSSDFPEEAKTLLADLEITLARAAFDGASLAKKVLPRNLSLIACCIESGDSGEGFEKISSIRETSYQLRTKAASDFFKMDVASQNETILATLEAYPQVLGDIARYVRNPSTFRGDFAVIADRVCAELRSLPENQLERLIRKGDIAPKDATVFLQTFDPEAWAEPVEQNFGDFEWIDENEGEEEGDIFGPIGEDDEPVGEGEDVFEPIGEDGDDLQAMPPRAFGAIYDDGFEPIDRNQ